MIMQTRCWLLLLVLGGSALNLLGQKGTERWRLDSANIELSSGAWNGQLHAKLSTILGPQVHTTISTPAVSSTIDQVYVSGDRLVVLGDAGRTQAVEIFDIPSGRKVDWFFCYSPKRISRSMIASTEFYPTMTADVPTDVLLIYNLLKSP